MVYYLVYSVSAAISDRTRLTYRLRDLGGEQLGSTFWKIPDDKIANTLDLLESANPIVFRKIREITKPRFNSQNQIDVIGSLVLFQIKPNRNQRENLRPLLQRTPIIRLSRGVIALPQRGEKFDPRRELTDWQQLYQTMKQMGVKIRVFLNMIPINRQSQHRIVFKAETIITNLVSSISDRIISFLDKASALSLPPRIIVQRTRIWQRRIKQFRKIGRFFKKWLHIDFEHQMLKVYPLLHRLREQYQRQYEISLELDF
jgi:hypothetical protein